MHTAGHDRLWLGIRSPSRQLGQTQPDPGELGRHEMGWDEARCGQRSISNKLENPGTEWERASCLADEGVRLAVAPREEGRD